MDLVREEGFLRGQAPTRPVVSLVDWSLACTGAD